jgi:hypothetical protein
MHRNTHTCYASPIVNILESVKFGAFMKEKYLSAVPILNEYEETLLKQVNFFKHSLPMV